MTCSNVLAVSWVPLGIAHAAVAVRCGRSPSRADLAIVVALGPLPLALAAVGLVVLVALVVADVACGLVARAFARRAR
jgi:hypothetical protein